MTNATALTYENLTNENPFQPARRQKTKIKLALVGTAGTGKTYTALRLATAWGGKVALIDSERGSSTLYAKEFDFDVMTVDDHHPKHYTAAIRAAAYWGYDTIIIDSLSHPWSGPGGILEIVDKYKGKNRFEPWEHVNPFYYGLIDAILETDAHIIGTLRGKPQSAEKDIEPIFDTLGIAPDQRNGFLHEFDMVGVMDAGNTLHTAKSRMSTVRNLDTIESPGPAFAKKLLDWANEGDAPDSLFADKSRLSTWLRAQYNDFARGDEEMSDFAQRALRYLNDHLGTHFTGFSGLAGLIEPRQAAEVIEDRHGAEDFTPAEDEAEPGADSGDDDDPRQPYEVLDDAMSKLGKLDEAQQDADKTPSPDDTPTPDLETPDEDDASGKA